MALYKVYNGAVPTTARQIPVATGTAIKTLLQVTTPATDRLKVVSWGIDFGGSAAGVPGNVELLTTGAVAGGSPTAVTPTIIQDSDPASAMTAGFSPTSEGSIASVRMIEARMIAPTSQYGWEFSLGREPLIAVSTVLRIRVHFAVSVDAICWIMWEE